MSTSWVRPTRSNETSDLSGQPWPSGPTTILASLFLSYSFFEIVYLYLWPGADNWWVCAATILVGGAILSFLIFGVPARVAFESRGQPGEWWSAALGTGPVRFLPEILLLVFSAACFTEISHIAARFTDGWLYCDSESTFWGPIRIRAIAVAWAAWVAFSGTAGQAGLQRLARFTNKVSLLIFIGAFMAVWRSLPRYPQRPLDPVDFLYIVDMIEPLIVLLTPVGIAVAGLSRTHRTTRQFRASNWLGIFVIFAGVSILAIGTQAGAAALQRGGFAQYQPYIRSVAPTSDAIARTKLLILMLTLIAPARFVAHIAHQRVQKYLPRNSRAHVVLGLCGLVAITGGEHAGQLYPLNAILRWTTLAFMPLLGVLAGYLWTKKKKPAWTGPGRSWVPLWAFAPGMLLLWLASVYCCQPAPFPISLLLSYLPSWLDSHRGLFWTTLFIALPLAVYVIGCGNGARRGRGGRQSSG